MFENVLRFMAVGFFLLVTSCAQRGISLNEQVFNYDSAKYSKQLVNGRTIYVSTAFDQQPTDNQIAVFLKSNDQKSSVDQPSKITRFVMNTPEQQPQKSKIALISSSNSQSLVLSSISDQRDSVLLNTVSRLVLRPVSDPNHQYAH